LTDSSTRIDPFHSFNWPKTRLWPLDTIGWLPVNRRLIPSHDPTVQQPLNIVGRFPQLGQQRFGAVAFLASPLKRSVAIGPVRHGAMTQACAMDRVIKSNHQFAASKGRFLHTQPCGRAIGANAA
jgi:hypothetical protein